MTYVRTDFSPMTRAKLGSVHHRYDADHECTRWELHTTEEVFQAAMKMIAVMADKQPRGWPYPVDSDYEENCWGWARGDGYTLGATAMDDAFVVIVHVWPTAPFYDWDANRADPDTWVLAAKVFRDVLDHRHLLDAAITIN